MSLEPWAGVEEMRKRGDDGPVVMLNLLKFNSGGFEKFMHYVETTREVNERVGGRIIYSGLVAEQAHDDNAPDWDLIALVEFPNRSAFIEMATDPLFQSAHVERAEAVEYALLRATDPLSG